MSFFIKQLSTLFNRPLLPAWITVRHFRAATMSSPPQDPAPAKDDAGPAADSAEVPTAAAPEAEPSTEPAPLPALSPAEFREYNRMAEHMDHFVRLFFFGGGLLRRRDLMPAAQAD